MNAMSKVLEIHPGARIQVDLLPGASVDGTVYSVVAGTGNSMILAMAVSESEAWELAAKRLNSHYTGSFLQG